MRRGREAEWEEVRRGGGATVPDNNHLDGLLSTRAAVLRSCVNVEVAVLGSRP